MGALLMQSVRLYAFLAAMALMVLGSPGAAHDDHEELGAGPGPAQEQVEPKDARVDAASAHEGMAEMHEMATEEHEAAADRNKTFGERLISWLGRLHTLAIHFPIAMFVGALAVELVGLWRRDATLRSAAHVMLVVGAAGAVGAAALGWFAGGFYLTDRNPVLMLHRWLGTAIAIAGLLLLYLSAAARRHPQPRRRFYWIILAGMTLAIAVQGYIGGSFMHGGMDHLAF
jgi:uncharacterized membrane protein